MEFSLYKYVYMMLIYQSTENNQHYLHIGLLSHDNIVYICRGTTIISVDFVDLLMILSFIRNTIILYKWKWSITPAIQEIVTTG